MSDTNNQDPLGGIFTFLGAVAGAAMGWQANQGVGLIIGLIIGAMLGWIVEHVIFRLLVVGITVLMIATRLIVCDAIREGVRDGMDRPENRSSYVAPERPAPVASPLPAPIPHPAPQPVYIPPVQRAAETVHAVTVRNTSRLIVTYRVNWNGEIGELKTLNPDQTLIHTLSGDLSGPRAEIEYDADVTTDATRPLKLRLNPRRVDDPRSTIGTFVYEFAESADRKTLMLHKHAPTFASLN